MSALCRRQQNEHGFTLIELMATLGILALIALIAVPAIGSIIGDAETETDAASIRMVESAARTANASGLAPDHASGGYTLPTLIDGGYLDIPAGSVLTGSDAAVQKFGHDYYYTKPGVRGENLVTRSNMNDLTDDRSYHQHLDGYTYHIDNATRSTIQPSLFRLDGVAAGTYTFSGYFKLPKAAVANDMGMIRISQNNASTKYLKPETFIEDRGAYDASYIYLSHTFDVTANNSMVMVQFYLHEWTDSAVEWVTYKNLKLERGDVATPHVPSADDFPNE